MYHKFRLETSLSG